MAPRETENNNVYAKFWDDKQRVLWYVTVFSGVVNCKNSKKTFLQLRCANVFYSFGIETTPLSAKN